METAIGHVSGRRGNSFPSHERATCLRVRSAVSATSRAMRADGAVTRKLAVAIVVAVGGGGSAAGGATAGGRMGVGGATGGGSWPPTRNPRAPTPARQTAAAVAA